VLALAVPGSVHAAAHAADAEPSEVAMLVARRTSAFRAANGLEGLAVNRALSDAAQHFAEFMARADQYGHDVDGRKPAERARAHGYDHCVIAENIAYRFSSSGFSTDQLAAQLVEGWEQSPRHRQNMLLPNVVDLGVGIARSGRTQHWYAVQLFGRPKSASARFEIVNPTDVALRYELDAQGFELPPRVTRTHQGCFSGALKVVSPEAAPDAGLVPRDGVRYTVQRDAVGRLRLHASHP
jgi:hypothetical protein